MHRCGIDPPLLHSYDDQTGMYKDLANGNVDAVYIDLPVDIYYLPKYPGLELTGATRREGLLRHRLSQGPTAPCATSSTPPSAGSLMATNSRPIYQKWGVWNDDQMELAAPSWVRARSAYWRRLCGQSRGDRLLRTEYDLRRPLTESRSRLDVSGLSARRRRRDRGSCRCWAWRWRWRWGCRSP